MNKQISEALVLKQSLNYLIYGALCEIMLESYSNTYLLQSFDPNTRTKHKNLLTSWEKESKFIFKFVQEGETGEAAIKQYYQITDIFERIIESTKSGQKFEEIINYIDENILKK